MYPLGVAYSSVRSKSNSWIASMKHSLHIHCPGRGTRCRPRAIPPDIWGKLAGPTTPDSRIAQYCESNRCLVCTCQSPISPALSLPLCQRAGETAEIELLQCRAVLQIQSSSLSPTLLKIWYRNTMQSGDIIAQNSATNHLSHCHTYSRRTRNI